MLRLLRNRNSPRNDAKRGTSKGQESKQDDPSKLADEEWKTFDLEKLQRELNIYAPSAEVNGEVSKSTHALEGMSAHPDDQDLSFDQLMSEYKKFEMAVDSSLAEQGVQHEDNEYFADNIGTTKKNEHKGIMKHSGAEGLRANQSKVITEDGGKKQKGRGKGKDQNKAGDVSVRPTAIRWDLDAGGQARRDNDDAVSPMSIDELPAQAHMFHATTKRDPNDFELEAIGDAKMLGTDGLANFSKRNLLSIPMVVYNESDFGGKCFVLWAHQNRIKWLPEVIGRLTALTELRLHHNEIEQVPPEFAQMRNLKKLWLNDNKLVSCPTELGSLTLLEMLSLSRNPFDELCLGIGYLTKLTDLQLDQLNLKVPPREIVIRGPVNIVKYLRRIDIAAMSCLKYRAMKDPNLKDLPPPSEYQVLKLEGNEEQQNDKQAWLKCTLAITLAGSAHYQLLSGPTADAWIEIGNLQNVDIKIKKNKINYPLQMYNKISKKVHSFALLEKRSRDKLVEAIKEMQDVPSCSLSLNSHGLLKLPLEVSRMGELDFLDLSNNTLQTLPALKLGLLKTLLLDLNNFSSIPKTVYQDLTSLTHLSIIDNPIHRLPTALAQMKSLQEINMNSNFHLESPPPVVVVQGLHLRFLRSLLECEKCGVMDLSSFNMDEVPREVGRRWDEHPEYHKMSALKLDNNLLVEFDSGVDNWKKIRSLEMRANRLSRLPRTIGALNLLSELHLDDNELRELPQSAKNLHMLVALHIDNNQLDIWPPCLQYLTSITELFMNRNAIEVVPPECATMVHLRHLEVSGNRIYDLPPQVGGWTSLTKLKMDSNRLPALPETLGQLSKVESLSFANNSIITFPMEVGNWHNLRSLDLSKNDIQYLPASISNSTAMRQLFLEGNPLIQLPLSMGSMRGLRKLSYTKYDKWISPPNEVMRQSYHQVIQYLQAYHSAKQSNRLSLREMGIEFIHADVLLLSNLTELDISKNRLKTLTAVMGEADGRVTQLKGDCELYMSEEVAEKKRRAKAALLKELGEGLNDRQLRERSEKIFASIDEDGGGTLGVDELLRCFHHLGVDIDESVVDIMVKEVSNDGDDEIDMDEWVRLVNNIYKGAGDVQGIGDLKRLQHLNISGNDLKRLPYGLGFCTSLKTLTLDEPHFVIIPCDEILSTSRQDASTLTSYLRRLHDAVLSRRLDLTGYVISALPKEVIELTALTELKMSDNRLKVVVSEIEQLSQLQLVDLSRNRIKMLPATLGKLSELRRLDVSENRLKHLPAVLCNLEQLGEIEIHGNKDLEIPEEIQTSGTATLKLFLQGIFRGSADSVVDWSKVTTVEEHKLESLPQILFSMNWITDLNLDNNRIRKIPSEISVLKSMKSLSVRNNLVEKVSSDIKRCKSLTTVNFDSNSLTKIPLQLFTHLSLTSLNLNHNRLDSSILPEQFVEFSGSELKVLRIDCNALGKIPNSIELFQALTVFTANFNEIKMIPREISFCTLLKDIQLDGNQIQELPIEITRLSSLVRLKLNDNSISVLPEWIGKMSNLRHLSLGNNKLQFLPYSVSLLNLAVLTLDGNPLKSIETGVLMGGAKGLLEHLRYNHNYDIADRNLLPDVIEQRRQIAAYLARTDKELQEIDKSSLEAELKVIGGIDQLEIARNKRVGEDRTATDGAVILDQEMLDEVRILAERERAGAAIFSFLGPGLTGSQVRTRAKGVFYELDEDTSGTLDVDEFRKWLLSLGADISSRAIESFMEGMRSEAQGGELGLEEFQQLVYLVYQVKS
mmetsp:Transcript_21431/g.48531  ORF Transcript_21431/g.48531 Transcript_21431/m.48531 type:complete len:1759 (-) Transcript_21431:232-5508(-)